MGDKIIILILPAQRIGAGSIQPRPVAAGAVQIIVKIAERDAAVFLDSLMQQIDGIVDALVHGLDAPCDRDLPPQAPGGIPTCKRLQLGDQLHGFPLRQKPARLHRVDQQLELRQLKRARTEKIPAVLSLDRHDVHAELLQAQNIVVDTLALGADAPRGKRVQNVLHGKQMLLVRLPLKQLLQIKQLQLLIFRPSHRPRLLSVVVYLLYRFSVPGASGIADFPEL